MMRVLMIVLFLLLSLPSHSQGPKELEGEAREVLRTWEMVQREGQNWEEERRKLLEERERLRLQLQGLQWKLEKLKGYNANLSSEIAYLRGRLEELGRYRTELEPYLFQVVQEVSSQVEKDPPFFREERRTRIEQVRKILQDPDLPQSEKLRAVLDLLKAELEYSRTVEAREGEISLRGAKKQVYLLRLGRIGLYWLSLDGKEGGWFDPVRGDWAHLKGYEGELRRFLEIAQGKRAAELIRLPMKGVEP